MTVGTADLQLDSRITVMLASGPGIPLLRLGSTKKWFRFFEYWLCTGRGVERFSCCFQSTACCLLISGVQGLGGGGRTRKGLPTRASPTTCFWLDFFSLAKKTDCWKQLGFPI